MKKLRLIEVPMESKNHYINNVGCLRFNITPQRSTVIEPNEIGFYLDGSEHNIVGYVEHFGKKYIVIENI